MAEEITAPTTTVGEMQKRRETMADGRRYMIYYTFGTGDTANGNAGAEAGPQDEVKSDV